MKLKHGFFALFSSCFLFLSPTLMAQTNSQNTFVSAVDQDLNIKSIVIAPSTDNVSGIYARPLDDVLKNLVNEDKQWSLADYPTGLLTAAELRNPSAENILKVMSTTQSQAVLSAKVTKGSRGLTLALTLFVGRQGLPLLEESITDQKAFELEQLKSEAEKLFQNMKARMPFRATVMSRRGQQVTLNLGSVYGLTPGMNVSVVQIIKVNRHPKLQFMVGTEKEVLGRIKLTKVEPYLSFGSVIMEKEGGVIQAGAKILPEEYIKYPAPVLTPGNKVLQDLTSRPDSDLAFGDSPEAWTPEPPPQYGKIELLAGLSTYNHSVDLLSAGSISGDSPFTPNIAVRGEMWLNPEWFVGFGLRQAMYTLDNGLSGSTPGSLHGSMRQYTLQVGRNFLLANDFFGPKLQLSAGYHDTGFSVDSSNPLAYTNMKYGGLVVSFAGQFPVSDELPLDLGAQFNLHLNPSLSENKSSGSSDSNEINSFVFFGEYKLKPKLKFRAELLFDYYSSDFSGTGDRTDPAKSASHQLTTIMGGVQWLF